MSTKKMSVTIEGITVSLSSIFTQALSVGYLSSDTTIALPSSFFLPIELNK